MTVGLGIIQRLLLKLENLVDVLITSPSSGQVLTYNGSVWVNGSAGSGGVSSLNSLTGAVNLVAGTNITLTPSGQNITISLSGSLYSVVNISSNVTLAVSTYNFIDTTSPRSLQMPAPAVGATLWTKDKSFQAQTNNITFTQNASEKIEGLAASYIFAANGGAVHWVSDGTDWYVFN